MDTLYSLTEEYQTLLEYADSIDPDDEQVFLDTLEGITGSLDMKMDDYAVIMDHMQARENLIEREIKRLKEMKNAITNNRERMHNKLYETMVATDRKKVSTDLHTFSIVKNGGKLPLKIEGDVPDKYMKVVMEPDKDLIRKALDEGQELDFASYGERGEHLTIK